MVETDFRPTAENFAAHIYANLCNKGIPVSCVAVYESPENCAMYGYKPRNIRLQKRFSASQSNVFYTRIFHIFNKLFRRSKPAFYVGDICPTRVAVAAIKKGIPVSCVAVYESPENCAMYGE